MTEPPGRFSWAVFACGGSQWLSFPDRHMIGHPNSDFVSLSLPNLPSGYRHQPFETISSTNEYALNAAKQGESDRLWVTSNEQTAGRGRRGRHWSSDKGNLSATLLLIDPAPLKVIGQLPLLSATASHRAICDVVPPMLRSAIAIKWPNDVLWGDQKICGILLESTTLLSGQQAVVIGIGINTKHHPATTEGLSATDLSQSGYEVNSMALFERLAFHMDAQLTAWDQGRGLSVIREDWLERARGVGEPIVARLPNEEIHGTFEQLDDEGALVMRLSNGERRVIVAGDVFWPGSYR